MQQGARLCFSGNFLVDRSECPPLASRVLKSSGVVALARRRDAYAQYEAQGHLSSEGLGRIPGAEAQSAQAPTKAVSHEPVVNTPRFQAISCGIDARALGLRRKLLVNLIREEIEVDREI
jgi:hypothetical protein